MSISTCDSSRQGLFYAASFLSPKEQLSAVQVSTQFYKIYHSKPCWLQQCRTHGIPQLAGVSAHKLALDVFPMLLKNVELCRPLSEIDPAIVAEAIHRIYVRDSKGNIAYAPDPVEPQRFIKDTFVFAVPNQTISIEVDDNSQPASGQKKILKLPLTPNNLEMHMKKHFGIGFYKENCQLVLDQHGNDPITRTFLFMRRELAYRNMDMAAGAANAGKCGLVVSSLVERIFINFLVYANSRKYLDGRNPWRYALTSTLTTDAYDTSRTSTCGDFGVSGLRVLDLRGPASRSHGLAVGFPVGNV